MHTGEIIVAVIASSAFSTVIAGFIDVIKNKGLQKIVNQEMLLWRIKDTGKKAIAAGEISPEDFEDINRVYSLYKKIGGNGFAEAIMTKVKQLPLKEI